MKKALLIVSIILFGALFGGISINALANQKTNDPPSANYLTRLGNLAWVWSPSGMATVLGNVNLADNEKETREYRNTDFIGIEISDAIHFTIKQSDKFGVEISGSANNLKAVVVEQKSKVLIIGIDNKLLSTNNGKDISATIWLPELQYIKITAAAKGSIEKTITTEMEIIMTGASYLKAHLETEKLNVNLSGAAHLLVQGQATDTRWDTHGATQVLGRELVIQNANVRATGASFVTLDVKKLLDAETLGGARVVYLTEPQMVKTGSSRDGSVESGI